MKSLRFYLGLYAAKTLALGCRLAHRNGSHNPGVLAMKLCPNFFEQIDKPKTVIAITGTNGKTTTANLVIDILSDQGIPTINNRTGSNILGGVVTTLALSADMGGHMKKDLAVLELDERSSRLVYPHLKPDYILVTNLFQDSFKRNAHPEFIFDILDQNLPASSRLILNGDDLLSARLAPKNDRVYFGVAPQTDEPCNENNLICDLRVCPYCGSALEYDFKRYHHIGRAHCTRCAFSSPGIDYLAEEFTPAGALRSSLPDGPFECNMVGSSVPDAYNLMSVIALLSEYGLSRAQLADSISRLKILKSRQDAETYGDKTIVYEVAKGQNPVACSRIFDLIRHTPGRKAVVLMIDDLGDAASTSENIAWIYDVDYEFLNQEDVTQVICSGVRRLDHKVRLLLAGLPEEKITLVEKEADTAAAVDFDKADTVFFLYDVYTVHHADRARAVLKERFGAKADADSAKKEVRP